MQFFRNKTAIKSISWLLVSGVLITCTVWVETGSFKAALVSAIMACLIKTPVYSMHETAFERIWDRAKLRREVGLVKAV